VGYFVLKLHTHSHTFCGHQRFILHLVKMAFDHDMTIPRPVHDKTKTMEITS